MRHLIAGQIARMLRRPSRWILQGVCLAAAMQPIYSIAGSSGSIKIEREVLLAPGRGGTPNVITQTPDGGYVVAGAIGAAWASRVSANGEVQWEHLDTRDETIGVGTLQSQFNGAVVLANNSVLLCGTKSIDKAQVGLLTIVDLNGRVVEERLLRPNRDSKYFFSGINKCLPWGSGIALIGGTTSVEGTVTCPAIFGPART